MANEPIPAEGGEMTVTDKFGRVILTVGELKRLIADIDDERHVVIAKDEWYANVATVGLPVTKVLDAAGQDGIYACVTFFPGDDLDSRQF